MDFTPEMVSEYIKPIIKHDSKIVSIFKLPKNNEQHILSLSEDGQLKEWAIDENDNVEEEVVQEKTLDLLVETENGENFYLENQSKRS